MFQTTMEVSLMSALQRYFEIIDLPERCTGERNFSQIAKARLTNPIHFLIAEYSRLLGKFRQKLGNVALCERTKLDET